MAGKKEVSEDTLVIGDKVDIVSEDGQVYRSMVEDRVDDGPFLVSLPHRRGRYMYVAQDDVVYLVFYREGGRYIAQMKVLMLEKRGAIRYMWLLQETRAQKNQRREAFRLPVTVPVVVYEYIEGYKSVLHELDRNKPASDEADAELSVSEVVTSRDISIKGIAISSKRVYNIDDEYLLGVDIDNTSVIIGGVARIKGRPSIILKSVVRRCIPMNENKINHVGFRFFDETKEVSEKIARYVLIEQQRQIKSQRGLN